MIYVSDSSSRSGDRTSALKINGQLSEMLVSSTSNTTVSSSNSFSSSVGSSTTTAGGTGSRSNVSGSRRSSVNGALRIFGTSSVTGIGFVRISYGFSKLGTMTI